MNADQPPSEAFRSWGMLDLFGHVRLAGELSEETIGGCHFIRVDVPEVGVIPAHTRFFTQGAIYSMTPMAEATARKLANYLQSTPVNAYELRDAPTVPLLAEPDLRHTDVGDFGDAGF